MDKSQDLNAFINSDPENLDRFEQFLQEEGLKHQFEFVLAVRGLKSEPNHHLAQIIRTIYKHYFDVVHVSEVVRSKVKSRVTAREYSIDIFDDALEEVWDFLDTVVYKEFLNHLNQQSVSNTSNFNVNANTNSTVNSESCQSSTHNNNNNNNINSGNNSGSSSLSVSASASVVIASSNNVNPTQNLTDQVSISSSSINTLGNNNSSSSCNNNNNNSASSSKQTIKQIPTCSIPSASSSSSTSSTSAAAVVSKLVTSSSLEPLIEGQELRQQQQQSNSTCSTITCTSSSTLVKNPIVGLTRESLRATQKQRCERDFTVDCMPLSLSKPKFPYHYANYNSFNPVSRVDSEVASFSSGCLTDSECGYGTRGTDDRGSKRARKKEELRVNCDNLPSLQLHIKGKEMRCPKKSEVGCQNMDTQTFANVLIQKLQKLQKQREQEEKMKQNQKLSEEITQAIKEKLFVSSSNEVQPDDILDNHVSRVWSDVTPDAGRRDYNKRMKCIGNPVLRSRIHNKEQEHQIPKSRTFPSTKYNDLDSGISITTTSTTSEDLVSNWIQNMNNTSSSGSSKPNSKSNPAKTNKKHMSEISYSCVVYYPETKHPYYYKMTTSSNVSLNLFKEFLPKKPAQNYRYFFKYSTQEGIVREEIKNDEALVPMFDDYKIVAYLRDS